jgi:hypothetical protein
MFAIVVLHSLPNDCGDDVFSKSLNASSAVFEGCL